MLAAHDCIPFKLAVFHTTWFWVGVGDFEMALNILDYIVMALSGFGDFDIASNGVDLDRLVWIDIFGVRQV